MSNLLYKNNLVNTREKKNHDPSDNRYYSAKLFIRDLLKELNDLEKEHSKNECFTMFITFNNVIMAVKNCEIASQNQIKFTGEIDGLEIVAIVKISEFNYLFVKRDLKTGEKKPQIGFLLDK